MTKATTLLALILLALSLDVSAGRSQFCAGFEAGYVTGYKQTADTRLTPLAPMCPMQPMKSFGDPDSDYEHGYTIGFRHGVADASSRGY